MTCGIMELNLLNLRMIQSLILGSQVHFHSHPNCHDLMGHEAPFIHIFLIYCMLIKIVYSLYMLHLNSGMFSIFLDIILLSLCTYILLLECLVIIRFYMLIQVFNKCLIIIIHL